MERNFHKDSFEIKSGHYFVFCFFLFNSCASKKKNKQSRQVIYYLLGRQIFARLDSFGQACAWLQVIVYLSEKHLLRRLIWSEYVLDTLLVDTILTHFCWLTSRKQKLVQSKILQQGLFVLISSCYFRHVALKILSTT